MWLEAERTRRRKCAVLVVMLVAVPTFARADDDDASRLEEVVVTATRSPGLIRDEPLHVETVPTEEIEENLTIRPGNLTALLKELPGVRIQASAPGLGGAGMQLRGMPARDTLVLTDGLPLLGAEPDAFGLLQTPPLDLARVEVINGAVSALYGGSALGGVLNLVSRTADSEPGILANVTARGGEDLVGFLTHKGGSPWSETLTVGMHDQSRVDVNGDGWADLPGYRRYTLQPRVWWRGTQGRSLLLTAGIVDEDRSGGTVANGVLPDGRVFPQHLRTRRFNAGAVSQLPITDADTLSGRYSLTSTHLDRSFGSQRIESTQTTAFAEEAVNGSFGAHRWVAGVAFEHDGLKVPAVPGVGYAYDVPAVFAQDTYTAAPWLVVAGSVRVDAHNDYGTFVSPRASALWRAPHSAWSLRASIGAGYSAPTPLLDDIEATGFGPLSPLRGLHAERATTASIDGKWADDGWDINVSIFTSEIRDPLAVVPTGGQLRIINAPGPRRAPGAELLIGYVAGPLHAIASFSSIHATQADLTGARQGVPLVPRETASLDAILESEQRGRIGFELDYTGPQTLENDPFRATSPAFVAVNALAEIRFKGIGVFLNALNLTNVRQTQFDPLLRPGPGPGGNPITDVWAPLDGRTFNLGIRLEL
ncbi:MAG: TonB-dependent receptor [Gammaproteobacteria bacterium]|nr:TonB-dependent receptor [Gammaproteobacteria bacterium]